MSTYLNAQEAAELLGLTPHIVRQHCANGLIRAEKFGYDWKISREAIKEYKANLRKAAQPKSTDPNDK